MTELEVKKWGKKEYWGLGCQFDPDWVLSDDQKRLRNDLIELCRTKIRPNAAECDKNYTFPRKSLDALSELGLFSLIVPKELGGLGENHVGACMVVETIARYGCPSTAMVYTMHLVATAAILFKHHDNEHLKKLLKSLNSEKMVGSCSFSDPATGSHFWFPFCSKSKTEGDFIKILKYGSWATSAGYADWYTVQTTSPDVKGDYSDLATYVIYKDEVRSSSDEWSALGMHGNQSGPITIEAVIPKDRIVGKIGAGNKDNEEGVTFLLSLTSSVWNGISIACMDVAKKHVTRKTHADVGMRICDYPTIQDYFGDCIASTSVCRSQLFLIAKITDEQTNNCDFSLHKNLDFYPRSKFVPWWMMTKYECSRNVSRVSDTMLSACGGTGYKAELGFERLLRDAKAGCVMGTTNEVIRQILGKTALLGADSVDLWAQKCNERVLHHEIDKMNSEEKRKLACKLLEDASKDESVEGEEESREGAKSTVPLGRSFREKERKNEVEDKYASQFKKIPLKEDNMKANNISTITSNSYQDTDFDNPFHTSPPRCISNKIMTHPVVLHPLKWTPLKLISKSEITNNVAEFSFELPDSGHSGCYDGQFLQIKVNFNGKEHLRYFSPVSNVKNFGKLDIVIRYETHGIVSQCFKNLKIGETIDFRGPSGGFEYEPNKMDKLYLLTSGGGLSPALQIIRACMADKKDATEIALVHYADFIQNIFYKEELDNYTETDTRLKLFYTLGEAPEIWDYGEGFIDLEMLNKNININDHKYKILICGGQAMITSCLYALKSLNVPSNAIFIYGPFGTNFIRAIYGKNTTLSPHKF